MEVEVIDKIDIKEDDIAVFNKGKVLKELLTDHTRRQLLREQKGHEEDDAYIIWATDDYKSYGDDYLFACEIKPELITGENRNSIIMPRVLKDKVQQVQRSKDKAEVFTPSWVCNAQNNLIDEAWFGRKEVFNKEEVLKDGTHTWTPTEGNISFEGTGKTWEDYIRDTRMEITCGEAPYLVSRYDTTTGEEISLERRIGLLDRKMRVINENVKNLNEWKKWAKIAYHNIYGFEWQGDNLLLAREALFYTLLDYYEDVQKRLGMKPKKLHPSTMQSFAYIISWNIWQMDGLKFVIPETCKKVEVCTNQKEIDAAMNDPFRQMFPEEALPIPEPKYELQECPGCASGEHTKHTGIYSKIRDWGVFDNDHKDKEGKTGKERCDRPFIEIYNETKNKRYYYATDFHDL